VFLFVVALALISSWDGRSAFAAEEEAAVSTEPDPSTLPGVVFTRPDGSYMAVELVGPKLVFRFYDYDLNPIAADVDRATIRVFGPGRDIKRYLAIQTDDGMELRHGPTIHPPFVFQAYFNLYRGEDKEAVENYTASFPDREKEAE